MFPSGGDAGVVRRLSIRRLPATLHSRPANRTPRAQLCPTDGRWAATGLLLGHKGKARIFQARTHSNKHAERNFRFEGARLSALDQQVEPLANSH
jgi:hypothetical protein